MARSTTVKELLAATTSAGDSTGFSVTKDQPQSVFVDGLAGAEVAVLEATMDNGASFFECTDPDGTIQATADVNSFMVEGPGEYRVAKTATASAVAVSVVG